MAIKLTERNNGREMDVRVSGKVVHEDFPHFVHRFEQLAKQHGKIRVLFDMTDFHGWETLALWDDLKFDVKHFNDIERLAMVGDKNWEEAMAIFCKPFTTAKIHYFDHTDLELARQWLGESVDRCQVKQPHQSAPTIHEAKSHAPMSRFTRKFLTIQDLFIGELRDLFSAENQWLKALPKMAELAHSYDLKSAFSVQIEKTRKHIERLKQIFDGLGKEPAGVANQTINDLIKEGEEYASASPAPNVCDAGLIAAVQRIEHYLIAGYRTGRSLAGMIGEKAAARLLQTTLQDDAMADQMLNAVAVTWINPSTS